MAESDYAVQDLGRLIGLPDLAFDEEGCATLEFDASLHINLWRESDDVIEIWAHVSGFGPVTDPVILRAALEGNAVNGMTGGARLALDPGASQFTLCERIRAAGMSGAQLEEALHGFLAVLAYWNGPDAMPDRLSAPPQDTDDLDPPADDAVFIRL